MNLHSVRANDWAFAISLGSRRIRDVPLLIGLMLFNGVGAVGGG